MVYPESAGTSLRAMTALCSSTLSGSKDDAGPYLNAIPSAAARAGQKNTRVTAMAVIRSIAFRRWLLLITESPPFSNSSLPEVFRQFRHIQQYI